VDWWGNPNSGGSNFQVSFYADGGGVPGAILATFAVVHTATSVLTGSGFDPVFLYSANLVSPFHAVAGTEYWISVFNAAPDASWHWLSANALGDGAAQMFLGGVAWTRDPAMRDMAFELETAPEPVSFLSLGTGLAGIVLCRYRRRS
jgi:hypothetical protein